MATSKIIHTSNLIKLTVIKPAVGFMPCITQVRWKKPRWVPKAPSKEFYVREPTPIDPVEHKELLWRYSEYRQKMEAIRNYLAEELKEQEAYEESIKVADETVYNECVVLVEQWNNEVAVLREKRQAEARALEEENIKKLEAEKAAHLLKIMTEAEQKLAYVKTKKFITMETIDAEIEKVLDTEIDYEYAIDSEGYRYTHFGKEPLPSKEKKALKS